MSGILRIVKGDKGTARTMVASAGPIRFRGFKQLRVPSPKFAAAWPAVAAVAVGSARPGAGPTHHLPLWRTSMLHTHKPRANGFGVLRSILEEARLAAEAAKLG